MRVCKFASMQVCEYVNLRVCELYDCIVEGELIAEILIIGTTQAEQIPL